MIPHELSLTARLVHPSAPGDEAQHNAASYNEGLKDVELVNGGEGEQADAQRGGGEGADGVHVKRHAEHGCKDEANRRGVHTCTRGGEGRQVQWSCRVA